MNPDAEILEEVGPACAHAIIRLMTDTRAERTRAWWSCSDCGTLFAPASRSQSRPPQDAAPSPAVDHEVDQEYLSVRDLARRIPYTEGSIRNLMAQGTLRLGEHYVKPQGRVMFKWSAVRTWLDAAAKTAS